MSKKEPPLMQQIGPKKYHEKVEKAHKFYDQHKAGKRDPKTGEFYHNISFTAPKASVSTGQRLGEIECKECGRSLTVKTSTVSIICGHCSCNHSISYNRETEELTITANPRKKYNDGRESESTTEPGTGTTCSGSES